MPDISVIITTCGRIRYLDQALDSVLRQTFTGFEVWIINDRPGDHEAVCELVASKRDGRLRVISNPSQMGANYSRNLGIERSSGTIIAFLDDDDLWHARKLEIHRRVHGDDRQVGLVYSRVSYCWDLQRPVYKDKLGGSIAPVAHPRILDGRMCPPTASCATVRRECFGRVGLFDVSLASYLDWDMWVRISEQLKALVIDYPLTIFRQHPGVRASRTFSKRRAGLDAIRRKWSREAVRDPALRRFTCMMFADAANGAALRGERLEAARRVVDFLASDPTSVFGWARCSRMVAGLLFAVLCGRATLTPPFCHALGYQTTSSLASLLDRPVPPTIAFGVPARIAGDRAAREGGRTAAGVG